MVDEGEEEGYWSGIDNDEFDDNEPNNRNSNQLLTFAPACKIDTQALNVMQALPGSKEAETEKCVYDALSFQYKEAWRTDLEKVYEIIQSITGILNRNPTDINTAWVNYLQSTMLSQLKTARTLTIPGFVYYQERYRFLIQTLFEIQNRLQNGLPIDQQLVLISR